MALKIKKGYQIDLLKLTEKVDVVCALAAAAEAFAACDKPTLAERCANTLTKLVFKTVQDNESE